MEPTPRVRSGFALVVVVHSLYSFRPVPFASTILDSH
jgi:hypothetical protein